MSEPSRIRRSAVWLLVTSGLILVVLGLVLTYATHVVFDRRSFADRAARSVREPAVASLLADRISQAVIRANRDLSGYRPLIYFGARAVVSSESFASLMRASAETLHFVVFAQGGEDLLLNLEDGGILLRSVMPVLPPQLAERIPDDVVVDLTEGVASSRAVERVLPWMREVASRSAAAWWVLAGGGLLLLLAVTASRTPWRIGRETGWLLIFVALTLPILRGVGAAAIHAIVDDRKVADAAAAVWRTFLADAVDWALVLGGIGVVLLSPSLALGGKARAAGRWLTTAPARPLARLARAAGLIAGGYALVVWPRAVLELATSVAGVVVLAAGVGALGGLVFRFDGEERTGGAALRPAVIVATFVLTMVGGALWIVAGARAAEPAVVVTDACNGSAALCDRPLDRVVFATTHNSMSAADQPRWFFPAQEADVAAQLGDGIRGFQIDAHYGHDTGSGVLTVIHDEGAARRMYEGVIGKEGVDAAFRIRGRLLGQPRGPQRVYLCHGFCELGAVELVAVFRTMRDFLRRHPGEVLIVVIQDEDVAPGDIARAADESGLAERIYRGPVTRPWPTLRWMIEHRQQVLIVAENQAGDVPWYHPAFEVFQETPYDVRAVTDFSCRPWRGGTRGTLFQLNHWITRVPAPRPSDAALVNSHDFLMRRVRACMRQRHLRPTLLAVDYYRTGDLFEVVDELNQ
ncbi:MAG TPA: hypothetical protein VM734_18610 [Kofleriaceae bacterium]|nr:hypothetical protein [Kofleriaceae bacterium]